MRLKSFLPSKKGTFVSIRLDTRRKTSEKKDDEALFSKTVCMSCLVFLPKVLQNVIHISRGVSTNVEQYDGKIKMSTPLKQLPCSNVLVANHRPGI